MPRFYFHYRDGVESIDHDGVELADAKEARAMAVFSSGEAIRDLGERFWHEAEWQTWVTNDKGATVCSLRFSGDPGPA